MRRVKKRTFSGVVCEQEVFTISDRVKDIRKAEPRQRFKTPEEREQHRINISRKKHARYFNENFSPRSLYSTLTFDVEHECHEYRDVKRIRDLFVRRLKYAYPDAVIFIYVGRGKSTHRFHIHMVSDGIPEEFIEKKWEFGSVLRIEHLREHNYYNGIDHGQDYTGLANYLFDHWTPEQGGHRWKQTRNAKKPEAEKPTEVKRSYSEAKPPRPPKGYIFVEAKSTKYGYQYFKYVLEPPKRKRTKPKKADFTDQH